MNDKVIPWLLLPGVLLTLGSVSLLAPPRPASAAAPQSAPKIAEGDGDGDELLEHWGDPRYAREERTQIAGIAGAFVLLGITSRRRTQKAPAAALRPAEENTPVPADIRKAA